MSDYKSAAEMIEFQAAELRNRDEALARVVRERDAAIRRADRAEALLRACVDAVRVAASAEEDYGALDRARELDALLAKIREALA